MKKILTLLLITVICIPVFAVISFSPGFQGSLGGAFLHPTDEYLKTCQGKDLPEFRTSFTAGFDFDALSFSGKKFRTTAGFSTEWTSQSLAAGIHVIQPYYGIGFSVGGIYRWDNGFGLGAKGKLLWCKYRQLNYKFNVMELELIPSYKITDESRFQVSLIAPVTCSIKSDAVTVKLTIGFDFDYVLNLEHKEHNYEK